VWFGAQRSCIRRPVTGFASEIAFSVEASVRRRVSAASCSASWITEARSARARRPEDHARAMADLALIARRRESLRGAGAGGANARLDGAVIRRFAERLIAAEA